MIRLIGTYKIPEWAICYLANGDRDNLSDDEVDKIETLCNGILEAYGGKWITWDFDVMDEDKYGNYYRNEFDTDPDIDSLACVSYDIPCWVGYDDGEKEEEYDIVLTSDIYGSTKITVYQNKKFFDSDEVETWVNTYFKHYGYSMDYSIFPSKTNTVTIL